MATLRILLFSTLAASALYIPFYYFAPLYWPLYEHVNIESVNEWARWAFAQHNGAQVYIAYALMFLAIVLAFSLEHLHDKFVPPQAQWILLFIAAGAGIFYLKSIGFHPPMADAGTNGQGFSFILAAVTAAFIFGFFFDCKAVKGLLMVLLCYICMVPATWSFLSSDYFYLFAPALRTLKGCALSQSYFQYDQLLSFLVMGWIKLGLPLDRFHVLIAFFYFLFFMGIYFLAKNFFLNKKLVFYFVFSLLLIKAYGNLGTFLMCPQVSPLRLDLWLVILGLAYGRGPQHWTVGLILGICLSFHHAFGLIYAMSYLIFVFILWVLDRSKPKQFLPNICLMAAGELVNRIFVSSHKMIPALNYVKYNIGFMPIDPRSLFWYVPVVMSMAFLLLWKSRAELPQRYFQTGIFLILLAIGNLVYFFGRSHENNLINIAASLWMVFFMLMDLIVFRAPETLAGVVQKLCIPLAGVLIVGAIAYFYSGKAIDRLKSQAANLPKMAELFQAEKSRVVLDYNAVRKATQGSPEVIFLSMPNDFDYYYDGRYTPVEFCPLGSNLFIKDLIDSINDRIAKGSYIIVPASAFYRLKETVVLLKAQYAYRISDFLYISNNQPAI